MEWTVAGERGIRLVLAEKPSPQVSRELSALREILERSLGDAATDMAIGYTTLTLFFEPERISHKEVVAIVEALSSDAFDAPDNVTSDIIELPVYYSAETGADLEDFAREKSLSVDAVISLHSSRDYHAYANGFAPGFCYLGEIDEQLAIPRLPTPRRSVPSGSVAVADRQTAVYPSTSPGGWRLLGRCPLPLFDITATPPTRITVGDTVRFIPIDRAQYLDLGGEL